MHGLWEWIGAVQCRMQARFESGAFCVECRNTQNRTVLCIWGAFFIATCRANADEQTLLIHRLPELSRCKVTREKHSTQQYRMQNALRTTRKRYGTRDSEVIPDLRTNRAWRRLACKFEMGLRASDCTLAVSVQSVHRAPICSCAPFPYLFPIPFQNRPQFCSLFAFHFAYPHFSFLTFNIQTSCFQIGIPYSHFLFSFPISISDSHFLFLFAFLIPTSYSCLHFWFPFLIPISYSYFLFLLPTSYFLFPFLIPISYSYCLLLFLISYLFVVFVFVCLFPFFLLVACLLYSICFPISLFPYSVSYSFRCSFPDFSCSFDPMSCTGCGNGLAQYSVGCRLVSSRVRFVWSAGIRRTGRFCVFGARFL